MAATNVYCVVMTVVGGRQDVFSIHATSEGATASCLKMKADAKVGEDYHVEPATLHP
jgi:hypothetical protein